MPPIHNQKIVPSNSSHEIILNVSMFLKLIPFINGIYDLVISQEDPSKEYHYKIVDNFNIFIFMLYLILNLYDHFQQKKYYERSFMGAKQEIDYAEKAIEEKYSGGDRIHYNSQVSLFRPHPDTDNKLCVNFYDVIRIGWTVGQGDLSRELQRVKKRIAPHIPAMSSKLQHSSLNSSLISFWKKCLPYRNPICDFPTKTRFLLPTNGWQFASFMMRCVSYYSHEKYYDFLFWPFFILFLLVGIAENYVKNERRTQYHLEGFNEFFGPYLGKYPTCIGRQISSNFMLYPSKELKEALFYLYSANETLKSIDLSKLLPQVRNEVECFLTFMAQIDSFNKSDSIAPSHPLIH